MAFIMDPIGAIDIDKDTTFVLMLEAQERGHEVWYLLLKDMFLEGDKPYGVATGAKLQRAPQHYSLSNTLTLPLDGFDVVWMRKDPPFDMDYIYATYILSHIKESSSFVINNPRGIRESNEKLYTLNFPDLMPPTLVSKDIDRIKGFLAEVGGEMVVKPLDSCGGEGVFYLSSGDKNVNVILEGVTHGGEVFVMAQKFIKEVSEGDKRILLLNGDPIGAVLRMSRPDDFRCNFHSGGHPAVTEITERDKYICDRLAAKLREDGLYFVGIDVIGGYITEINTTSPTGVQEINRFHGVKLESLILDFVEQRCGG
ncbi:MAG: glutathione synthase [Candidatus Dadabacteria bacterium]|nr:glutathione synthase [Candidatus Dadabacteria bacterium]